MHEVHLTIKADRSIRKMIKERDIPLYQADAILTDLDNHLQDKEKISTVELSLVEEEKTIFRDELELGDGTFQSLILFVTNTLDNVFSGIPEQDKNEFLEKLIVEIHRVPFLDEEDKNEKVNSYIAGDKQEKLGKEELISSTEKQPVNKPFLFSKLFRRKRRIIYLFSGVVVLFVGVFVYFSFFPETQTLQQAFNNADYTAIIQSDRDSQKDLLLKAKAYIKLSKVYEAEKINKKLKNKELTYLIDEFYIRETYRFIQEKNLTAVNELITNVDNKQLTKDVERAKEILSLLGAIDAHLKDTNLDTINRLKDHLNKEYDLIQFNAY